MLFLFLYDTCTCNKDIVEHQVQPPAAVFIHNSWPFRALASLLQKEEIHSRQILENGLIPMLERGNIHLEWHQLAYSCPKVIQKLHNGYTCLLSNIQQYYSSTTAIHTLLYHKSEEETLEIDLRLICFLQNIWAVIMQSYYPLFSSFQRIYFVVKTPWSSFIYI